MLWITHVADASSHFDAPNWFCESQVPCCLRELWLLALENWEALQAA